MDKFICHGCAKCCKKFGPKGLPLFDFEKVRAEGIAARKNIKLNIKPVEVFLDKISGKKFAVLYGLFQEPCPFLKDNMCSIYEQRFMICKQFPIFSTAKFKFAKVSSVPEFMECGSFDTEKQFSKFIGSEFKTTEQIQNYLKETYENCFVFAEKSNEETTKIMDLLISLQKSGKVDLESTDYSKIEKEENILGFREFLRTINQT